MHRVSKFSTFVIKIILPPGMESSPTCPTVSTSGSPGPARLSPEEGALPGKAGLPQLGGTVQPWGWGLQWH